MQRNYPRMFSPEDYQDKDGFNRRFQVSLSKRTKNNLYLVFWFTFRLTITTNISLN